MSVICFASKEKLLNFKLDSSYKARISRLESLLSDVRTSFTRRYKEDIRVLDNVTISDGVQFFRDTGIEDKFIYELLQKYYESHRRKYS